MLGGGRRAVFLVLLATTYLLAAEASSLGVDGLLGIASRQEDDPCLGACTGMLSCVVSSNGSPYCVDCAGLLKPKFAGAPYAECCRYHSDQKRCVSALGSSEPKCLRSDDLFVSLPTGDASADVCTEIVEAEKLFGSGNACFSPGFFRKQSLGCKVNSSWRRMASPIRGETDSDYSGSAVAMSADGFMVAVGARGSGGDSGHVRVYQFETDLGWTRRGQDIHGGGEGEQSGYSVAMSANGDVVAIGSPGANRARGRVRVYEYQSGAWKLVGRPINGEFSGDFSGNSVAMSGNGKRVAIGASANRGNGRNSGHARVYDFVEGSGWVQAGGDIDGENVDDFAGWSVDISTDGQRIAVGSYGADRGTSASDIGNARIYQYSESSGWVQMGSTLTGDRAQDFLGASIAISGDGKRVAIGADGNDGNDRRKSNVGHVKVFEYDEFNSDWDLVGSAIEGETRGDFSGGSIAITEDGERVIIGSIENDGSGGNRTDSGHVRVYELRTQAATGRQSWQKVGFDIDGQRQFERSGWAVAISANGRRLAIGSPENSVGNDESGQVRVFEESGRCD